MLPTAPEKDTTPAQVPGAIAFSIEGDIFEGDEVYGPAFAGTFKVKYPTLGQTLEIAAKRTAAIQSFGVREVYQLDQESFDTFAALAWLGVCAVEMPPWCSIESEGTRKMGAAIRHATRTAERLLAEGKKKSAGTGSSTA